MKLRKKLHLEVKCPQKQWLKRLFRSDLVGIGSFNREKERERKKEREMRMRLGEGVWGRCRRGRQGGMEGVPVTGMFFKFDKVRHD